MIASAVSCECFNTSNSLWMINVRIWLSVAVIASIAFSHFNQIECCRANTSFILNWYPYKKVYYTIFSLIGCGAISGENVRNVINLVLLPPNAINFIDVLNSTITFVWQNIFSSISSFLKYLRRQIPWTGIAIALNFFSHVSAVHAKTPTAQQNVYEKFNWIANWIRF